MYKTSWLFAALAFLLIAAVCSSGCIAELNPTPDEVKIRGNIISVDPAYVSNDIIWVLLLNPNNYEPVLFSAVESYLPRDNPVIEVGCGIGALSAFVNDLLTYPVDQVSIEPNPHLQEGLKKTQEVNNLRCTFLEAAVAYGAEKVEMQVSSNILNNKVLTTAREDTVLVDATSLEEVAKDAGFTNKNLTIIMTAVGSEHTIVQKESAFFKENVDTVICAVYADGKANADTFTTQMQKAGFSEVYSAPDESGGFTVEVYKKNPDYTIPSFNAGNEDTPVPTPDQTTAPVTAAPTAAAPTAAEPTKAAAETTTA
ncbi:MAG TPA: hypothetical protein O0X70_01605 [Methanocorpusculum sp.]|nr:hypothetical protein [Methanocorpusculum sp.]